MRTLNTFSYLDKNNIYTLFRFLKENGAFAGYMRNLKSVDRASDSCTFNTYYKARITPFFRAFRNRGRLALSHSFSWAHSLEGDEYWRKLNHKYLVCG